MDDLIKKYKDQIPGGRGDDLDPSDFDIETLKKGMKVEREHTTDPMLALEISLDHLAEDPLYYKKLETIDPHDDKSTAQPVKRKDEKPREFVTGDDIIELMSAVAEELLDRGQKDLAHEVTELVAQIASRR